MALRFSSSRRSARTIRAKPKYIASQSFVKLGERRDGDVAVLSGLKPGELVASSGQLKIINNAPVRLSTRRPVATARQAAPGIAASREIHHALHRPVHPPPGSVDRRQPADSAAWAAGALRPAGAAIPQDGKHRDHGDHHLSRRAGRSRAGLHHPADRTGGVVGRRHRLHHLDLGAWAPARSRSTSSSTTAPAPP